MIKKRKGHNSKWHPFTGSKAPDGTRWLVIDLDERNSIVLGPYPIVRLQKTSTEYLEVKRR